jgi:cathepsin L
MAMVVPNLQIVVMTAFVALAHAQSLIDFESFIELHGRSYKQGSTEFEMRKALYEQRKADSELHNSNDKRLWNAGVNKLWDWTEQELQTLRGWDGSMMPDGGKARPIRKHAAFLQQSSDLPKEKIWSDLAMAHRIRNQADCGSCWAIATATTLEAHAEIYTGKPRTFSAQQIVACTPNPRHCGGDGGCKGATAELAFDWVLKHGCAEESAIPYTGHDSACTMGSPTLDMMQVLTRDSATATGAAAFGMTGWETLPKNEYEPLARALAEQGPVAVSVAADTWFNYDSGIFNACGKDAVIDHAVVAIGYGEEGGHKYWVIQNSWGAEWGESGHIRLERHDTGDYCGMNNDPQKGVACEGETAPVPVCGMCGVLFDSVVPHFK